MLSAGKAVLIADARRGELRGAASLIDKLNEAVKRAVKREADTDESHNFTQ